MASIMISLTAVQEKALALSIGDYQFWATSVIVGRANAARNEIVDREKARLQAAGLPVPSDDAIVMQADGGAAPQLTVHDYAQAIQRLLDATAQSRQYDSMQTAVSYRDDPNIRFSAEAESLFAWRSAVWTYALAEFSKVEAGERAAPSIADFLAELPAFNWPEA